MPSGKGKSKGKGPAAKKAPGKPAALQGVAKPTRQQPGRANKQVRLVVTPVLACAVKGLLKGRSDKAQLKKHLEAIQAHRMKYEKRIQDAKALKAKGNVSQMHAVPAHKAKVTEAKGEHEATLLIVQKYCAGMGDYELKWGFSAGVGIDQLWYSASSDTYMVVEAKGPGAGLSNQAAKGDQMSKQWVRNSLTSVRNSKNTSDVEKADAKRMLKAMNSGPPPKVIGKVIEANKGGGAVERGCPDKGIYHAT